MVRVRQKVIFLEIDLSSEKVDGEFYVYRARGDGGSKRLGLAKYVMSRKK